MTKVQITPNSINVTGHSGYAAVGYDIVCASISTLCKTLLDSIETLTQDAVSVFIDKETTTIKLEWEELSESGRVLIDSFFIGVRGLVEAFPAYISLE